MLQSCASSLNPSYKEHVTAVSDVATVDLGHDIVLQHLRDNGFGVRPVVHSGVADPTSPVVRPQDLGATTPLLRVATELDWTVAGCRVGEDSAHFPVGAWREHWFVAEQEQSLAGSRVPQAASQRLAAGRGDIDDGSTGGVRSFGAGPAEHVIRYGDNLEGRHRSGHDCRLARLPVDCWRKTDIRSSEVGEVLRDFFSPDK